MRRWGAVLVAVLCAALSWGQDARVDFVLNLDAVEVSGKAAEGAKGNRFEDGFLAVEWEPTAEGFGFTLTNPGPEALRVDWSGCGIADAAKTAHGAVLQSVKHEEREKAQKPSVTLPGAALEGVIVTTDCARKLIGIGWVDMPIFSRAGFASLEDAREKCVGKTLEVLLALEKGAERREYVFRFKVTEVKPVT